ncbi:diguanylate cyclase domain-containing protein [Caldimonas sp. KR1-144]|uniref:diguanylate cyclase domain-containing protein n=1 Tax=Caldimonas sp. KR1-144 TaxID=3400911 RepID=UPI003C0D0F88
MSDPAFATAALRRLARVPLTAAVLACAASVLAGLAVVTNIALRAEWREQVEQTLRDADRTAQRLALRVEEVLHRGDQITSLVKSMREAGHPVTLTDLRHAGLLTFDVARAVFVTDARGMVIDGTSPDIPTAIADEPAFQRHARYNDLGLTIGPPQRHYMGGWYMPAMRGMARGGAEFDGVVVAYLDPATLTEGFGAGEAPGTAITVVGLDNVLRSRLRDDQLQFEGRMDTQRMLGIAKRQRIDHEAARSPIDGRDYFIAAVPVDGQPLFAVVGVASDTVIARYARARGSVLGWAGAFGTLVVLGALALWRQAHDLERSRRSIGQAQALLAATLEGSLDSVVVLRAEHEDGRIVDFRITHANTRAASMMKLDHEQLVGRRLCEVAPTIRDGGFLPNFIRVCETGVAAEGESPGLEPSLRGRWLHHQLVPVEGGLALITRDVTDQREAARTLEEQARQLAELARVDTLTGLPNRRHFGEHLRQACGRAERSGEPLALMFIDLDGFKQVNDNLGHEAGDALLLAVAERLVDAVRRVDFVARLGGDEFVIVLEGAGGEADRAAQCERVIAALSAPHVLKGRRVVATPSIGLAVWRRGEALDSLRQRADAAMYLAKRAGKGRWRAAEDAPRLTA